MRETMTLVVDELRRLNPTIMTFTLRRPDGGVLPAAEPGAHVSIGVPCDGATEWRHWSLVDLDGSLAAPRSYRLAVRLEEASRGGSRFVHEVLQPGHALQVMSPKNDFPLDATDDVVLIAGGIGVTPLIGMAGALARAGKRFALHYSGRTRAALAFVPELQALCGERLHIHADDEADTRLDLAHLVATLRPGQPIYVCGPRGMIERVIAEAAARGWAKESVRFELFTEAAAEAGDRSFEVELRQSGMTLTVPPDRSIVDVMEEAGLDPLYDCRRGECGVCTTDVIEGEIDHRDLYLSEAEKKSGKVMQICVSRARGRRLVLDA
jgi:ferredoxin-NADP reductase